MLSIRCPKCNWQPDGRAYWHCNCGTIWDTFSTGGRCPGCGKDWEYTQCVGTEYGGCTEWSLHLDWYEGLDDMISKLKDEIKDKWNVNQPPQNI